MSKEEKKKKILIIEDEPFIVMGLKDSLEFEGYNVISTDKGKQGVEILQREKPSCIILDLMLPDINGYMVCEEMRKIEPHVPIIILSARSQESDKIRGLEAGADDYVTKPFSIGELLARIKAIFRRLDKQLPQGISEIKIGDTIINPQKHILKKGKKEYELGFYELELIKLLFEKEGQPVSRDEILDKIWGIEANPTIRTVDNFIVKLRKKIEEQPDKPKHILTVYGFGYKLIL